MGKSIAILCAVVAVIAGASWYLAKSAPTPTPTATQTDAYATSTEPVLAAATTTTNPPVTPAQPAKIMHATLHTNLGDITIEFFDSAAPNTVANFIKLAQSGLYDGTKFHRVIKGFMNQGGDPLTKDDSKQAQWGTGGPGYKFADENAGAHNGVGVLSMANSGPDTNGSQFFINAADNAFLDGKYSVFGKVTAGMSVVTAINNTPTDGSDRPLTPVVLKSVTLK